MKIFEIFRTLCICICIFGPWQVQVLRSQSQPKKTATETPPSQTVILKWGSVRGATAYLVELSENSDFVSVRSTQTVYESSFTYGQELLPFYVRITAIGSSGMRGLSSMSVSLREYADRYKEVRYETDDFVNPSEKLEIFLEEPKEENSPKTDSKGKVRLPTKTYFRIDKGDWQEYKGTIPLLKEGWADVEFYSEDIVGNREEVKNIRILKDTTAPTVAWERRKPGRSNLPEYRPGDVLPYGIFEEGSGIRFLEAELKSETPGARKAGKQRKQEFSGNRPSFRSEYKLPESLQEGIWVLQWRSEDKAGNRNTGEFPIAIDSKGPSCEIVLPGARKEGDVYLLNDKSKVHVFCTDETSGVKEVRISISTEDGVTEFQNKEPFPLPIGKSAVTIRAYDILGNSSEFNYKVEVLDPDWPKGGTKFQLKK